MLMFLLLACTKPPSITNPMRISAEDGLTAELQSNGDIEDRLIESDNASLVVFYTGEQRADLAPCGCTDSPRGGLPRTAAYIDAAGDGLIINGSGWLDEGQSLDGSPMADAKLKNEWMIRGLQHLGTDIVHIGFGDLIGLSRMNEPPDLPMVSANLRGPGIQREAIIQHNGLTVGISGIADPGHISIVTPGFERLDPYESALPILEQLSSTVDIVILLNNGATAATKKLIRHGFVDVVIETAHQRAFEAPFRQGQSIWVRSHDQGLRLGELRLERHSDTQWNALDRKIDLNGLITSQPAMRAIAEEAEKELKALERKLFSP